MRMAVIFGMNQLISHGFGIFLFGALVPLMRETVSITYWHIATIGALTQLSYLGGALLLGVIGHRLASSRIVLAMGSITTALLFSMSVVQHAMVITIVLSCMAACAAISWGAIVEIVNRKANPDRCATYLSSAASGTAWGYGVNGLLILLVVPVFGWQWGWFIAGLFGVMMVGLTWRLLRDLERQAQTVLCEKIHKISEEPHKISNVEKRDTALSPSKLVATVFSERIAFCACVICFLAGFSTMPFATWLNTYLDELGLPAALGGMTWAMVGVTGMVAGFVIGKLADRKGHGVAFVVIFSAFLIGLLFFAYDPGSFALVAGVGYGLMYFPVWGILAGWIGRCYSPTVTMQISSICMVAAGLGGAAGNLMAGTVHENTDSLQHVYWGLCVSAILLVVVALFVVYSNRKSRQINITPSIEPC